ncbi:MAG: hypothetical protein H7235_07230 [Bdellovibrionaceae bacterium]|nr:hypothetical protein [Pseudobdellovibrionaceae bacterium]
MKKLITSAIILLSLSSYAATKQWCNETENDLLDAMVAYSSNPTMTYRGFLKTPIGRILKKYQPQDYIMATYGTAKYIYNEVKKVPRSEVDSALDYYLDNQLESCAQIELE